MKERNVFIMELKSESNFERAKFKFKFCGLMFGLGLKVTEAYDGFD